MFLRNVQLNVFAASMRIAIPPIMQGIVLLSLACASAQSEKIAAGRRYVPDYEPNLFGPLPFSEEVSGFLEHELEYLLGRQGDDGSWESAQPTGRGRSTLEAGGTVGNVTLTSMCGYSLRHYTDRDPERYGPAIRQALGYVVGMVSNGKLRSNVMDAPWHYIYALRFLVSEYPRLDDPKLKKEVEDACAILVQGLKDTQSGTYGQRSEPHSWNRRSNPGMIVADTKGKSAMVVNCRVDGPAHKAGLREGDELISANDRMVDSAIRYAMAELDWRAGDTVEFTLLRKGELKSIEVPLPPQYPGTLGLRLTVNKGALTIAGFALMGNRDGAVLKVGDVIRAVDGKRIATAKDIDQRALFAGQKVRISLEGEGKMSDLELVCAPVPAADLGVRFPGGRFEQRAGRGLRVDKFERGSVLSQAGLRPGDQLLRIDGALVFNRSQYRQVCRSIWGGKKIEVTFLRGNETKTVEVSAGTMQDERWLKGYHGIKLARGRSIMEVSYGSPADRAGCQRGDVILRINGISMDSDRQTLGALSNLGAGAKLALLVKRGAAEKKLEFSLNRPTESVWVARSDEAGGGWGYLVRVRGGNTFTTADALRELLKAKVAIPTLEIPDEMIDRAFLMLSKLRRKQPNGKVESYRYDAAGSFWGVKDIRGDVGRLNSAELACLMYTDSDRPPKVAGYDRTQQHLEKTLAEWLEHRGILDLVKFPKGHGKLSIAPWFWMYAYRTTLEAANYLTTDKVLQEKVRRNALKAFFKHMEFRFEPQLDGQGWIIGHDLSKELHDSCQLLDGLATMKHLWHARLKCARPEMAPVIELFYKADYGRAFAAAKKVRAAGGGSDALKREIELVLAAIKERFDSRLAEVKAIHGENPFDGLFHLRAMEAHFQGLPEMATVTALAEEWERNLPEVSAKAVNLAARLGAFPSHKRDGESDADSWNRILGAHDADPKPATWKESQDLLSRVDPKKHARRGDWSAIGQQLISPSQTYARLELAEAPEGNYRVEVQFTKLEGDCMAMVFPVGDTPAVLVVSGWGGKTSGIAFIDGKDANRNATTRDGTLSLNEKHTLVLEVDLLEGGRAKIAVAMDGAPYLSWQGERSAVSSDRQWSLRRPRAIGLGAYSAKIVYHSCQIQKKP